MTDSSLAARPAPIPSSADALEQLEIELLLEGIYRQYGYDFRNYAMSSLRRRLRALMQSEGTATISGLKDKVLHDPHCMERVLNGVSVPVSSMFRDPELYAALRRKVVPLLRTYPFVRIWHAGCATGEEVYSLAILLMEEGLYDRTRIYATDMNAEALRQARTGIFPLKAMRPFTSDYIRAGGTASFSEYYTARYDNAIFRPDLKKNLIFAQHNLVTDGPFNEFHLILCRNVLIYFNRRLQERVHELFLQSLIPLGFLCLGSKETLKASAHERAYSEFSPAERIYRRIRPG